ncbi:TIGR02391 family protein [Neisseria animaloris]|uniref:HSP90 family protein n=1 Tax=Neisseria animaloris TaxID=326522 RepID=A0A448U8V0_9NEIS|nr:TIGR02391 family protein [Neisseria animaloris]VEJ20318.1 HSP90 family protein [Neisseria animaloris]
MSENNLKMSFEPTVIEHLGVKMYSHTVPAIAELIANAYDACATEVEVNLFDNPEHKIVIKDNGIGMSFDEINDFYLRIGRNRRKEKQTSPCRRNPTGKKGLGKLALFGLGNKIEISTAQGNERVTFILDYAEILKSKGIYQPEFRRESVEPNITSGTTITLTELTKKQGYPLDNYVEHLSRLFDFPAQDFKIKMSLNGSEPRIIDGNLKYDLLTPEFEWEYKDLITHIPVLSTKFEQYESSGLIKGKFITTEKPLKNNMKGITLFANGRMVNTPEFFIDSASSHFYSYLTGWLSVDFIDDDSEDLIATDRTSLDWKHPKTSKLRVFLGEIVRTLEQDWRKKRKDKRNKDVKQNIGLDINIWQSKLPNEIKGPVQEILNHIDEAELPKAEHTKVVEVLHSLIPEYPYYHWRGLHSEIQAASKVYYEQKDYYQAFLESAKRYISNTRDKSGCSQSRDQGLMGEVFGAERKEGKKRLRVTTGYKRPNGEVFSDDTLTSIEEGQKYLSMGVVTGCRNPVAHAEFVDLKNSGLFTEKDCLDALGLLSHLQRRLEDSQLE